MQREKKLELDATKLAVFQTCPRKFLLQFVFGWRPEWQSNHLVFGQAWHEALELWWRGESEEVAFEQGFLPSYRSVLSAETDEAFWPKIPKRAQKALSFYAANWNRSDYEVLATEQIGEISLGFDVTYLVKIDTLVRSKETQLLQLIEHKSSYSLRFSNQETWESRLQILGYALWLSRKESLNDGVLVDTVAFLKNKGTRGGKLFELVKHQCCFTEKQLRVLHSELIYWFLLVDREFNFLEEGVPNAFPRAFQCSNFNGCEYQVICNACQELVAERPPEGFKIEFWNPREVTEK